MEKLVLPAIETAAFVTGCMAIHANRKRPDAVADALLPLAWMVGILSALAILCYRA